MIERMIATGAATVKRRIAFRNAIEQIYTLHTRSFTRTGGRSKSPLATENLLENTDGAAPDQCSLGAAPCCFTFDETHNSHVYTIAILHRV